MNAISILKDIDQNLETEHTEHEGRWMDPSKILEVKGQFKRLQIKILNIFTMAKSQLSTAYHQIVSRVKRIEKGMYNQSTRLMPTFIHMLQQIEQEIEVKMLNMTVNMEGTIISPFLFDQLLSFVPDSCSNELTHSQKKINNSSVSSGHRLTQKTINQTVADLDSISFNEYRTALKIKPSQKRADNLGCLSGRWEVLQQLNLENKKISMMVPLSTLIAETLQEINLSQNEIQRVDFFRGAEYPILRTLNLSRNLIASIDGLQEAQLGNLKILNLGENKLKKLEYLAQCRFEQLIELNLSSNRIEKAEALIQCNFPKLEVLNLDRNSLNSLEFMLSCSFYRLKILSFCYNDLHTIDCLRKCKFHRLQALLGYNNRIESIDFLEFCEYPQLKEIVLNNNAIEDIGVIERLRFRKLMEFDLENNSIRPKEVMCFVTTNDQARKAKKKYPFIQI